MTQTQKQNVPKLRFPGFEAALESVKLEDVATFSKGKGISKSDIDPDGDQFCIRYGELYTVYDTIIDQPISKTSIPASNLKLSKGDEVLVPASGEDAKDIATAAVVKQAGVALGGDLNIIHSKNDGAFLASYLSGRKRMTLAAMAQGNSVVHLYPAQLKTLDLHLPTLPEQRKIASFLGAVDAKITHLSRKKALLEDYKKGCMQQLFSQKIRFKDDDGNDFPDWEEKRLEQVANINPKSGPLPETFLYIDLESVSQGQLTDPKQETSATAPSRAQRLLAANDTLFQLVRPYQRNNYFFPGGEIHVASTGYAVLRARESPKFLYQAVHEDRFVNRVLERCTGTNYPAINSNDLAKIQLTIPHPAEQRKIADFLSALDRKIDLVAQELTFARSFKAGLLQQMFV